MENYKITGRAGEGAHGSVFKGLDLRYNKIVALKKIAINPEQGIPKNTLREICSLRALHAKNIVKLFEVTSMGSSVMLVMEFLPCSLQEVIKCSKIDLNLPRIKTYTKMLLKGISFMHSNHIMHRDIKPANLLISPKRVLKIADLGLARIFNPEVNRLYSHQVATRWYRAPELLYGSRTYNLSVDMWSVGCIIAEMVNKVPLFPGETDIEQLAIVLSILGTPTEENWPDLKKLPDYNKIAFISSAGKRWSVILPTANIETLDLIKNILLYDGNKRLTAKEALKHSFFHQDPKLAQINDMPDPEEVISNAPTFDVKEFDEIIKEMNKT
ncbi:cyclin-dependent kinase 20-like [Sitophilus oryzae]|uniref:Cyclin-dependent kinase 20 n=1 Tax=Sitophilus oryzae TaxID=7048 RepID=A0A6J2Y8J4_SITOR|nr:cyclin-dependent kinase 20-like [Sitophilus oryzae]XP_030759536.1 cyclin-dependent kinase 20-like [Sitophilus oryzae]